MKRRSWSKKLIYLYSVVTFTVIVITAIFLWKNYHDDSTEKNESIEIHTLTGTVTNKKSAALADAGDYLYVENMLVRTSNKASLHSGSTFDVDTSSIQKGDKVEVKYVQDTDGQATLDCRSCYIKKIE